MLKGLLVKTYTILSELEYKQAVYSAKYQLDLTQVITNQDCEKCIKTY